MYDLVPANIDQGRPPIPTTSKGVSANDGCSSLCVHASSEQVPGLGRLDGLRQG